MVSHYAAKFGGHKHCGSGDTNIHTNNLQQIKDVASAIVYASLPNSVIFIFFKPPGI